jgi:hypothetical protein
MKLVPKLILSSLLIGICGLVHGQTQSFRCNFSDGFFTEFKSNKQSSSRDKKFDDITFDQIDLKKGSGRMIGNAGAENVQVLSGDNSIHIFERTMTGNMNITTIFNTGKSNLTNYPVVHSRHVNIMDGPLPSQYVGFCKKLN